MPTFEEQMIALETVVQRLEHGDLALEESVQLFEEGVRLTASCRQELDSAEGRLQVLAVRASGELGVDELSVNEAGEVEGDIEVLPDIRD